MNGEFDKEKVLTRIKKMLALANDAAATEGERDNAMRMVHSTLAKYNLTLSEAEAAGETAEKRDHSAIEGRNYTWARRVASSIAEMLFCDYFYMLQRDPSGHKGKVQHYFVGRLTNIISAQELTKFVLRSIQLEATRRQRAASEGGNFWRSFCKGAADEVRTRCFHIRAEAEAAAQPKKTPGTAMVLASLYKTEQKANEEYIDQHIGDLRSSTAHEHNTFSGYYEGREYGKSISLNKQVKGGKTELIGNS